MQLNGSEHQEWRLVQEILAYVIGEVFSGIHLSIAGYPKEGALVIHSPSEMAASFMGPSCQSQTPNLQIDACHLQISLSVMRSRSSYRLRRVGVVWKLESVVQFPVHILSVSRLSHSHMGLR
jgi:hypothetical protein